MMEPAVRETLEAWSPPVPATLALVLLATLYVRGWRRLLRVETTILNGSHLAFFTSGVLALWIAIGSPLEAFDDELLSMHMTQHLLLMLVAPPLLLLGAPIQPILHGLPPGIVRVVVGPVARLPLARRIGHALTEPSVGWVAATVTFIGWHLPVAFELALQSRIWHDVEHASFFLTSLLFWWPVVQPWPSVARWPRWSMPPYLLMGMLANDGLSAFLTLYNRVLYPSYASGRRFAISPLEDQSFSGALMWAIGTLVYSIAAVLIAVQLLSPQPNRLSEQWYSKSARNTLGIE